MGKFNRDNNSGPRRDFDRGDFRKRNFSDRGERREMFRAVCDECGKECEVPFKPTGGRPIYCSECFEKREGGSPSPRNFQDRGSRRPDFERRPEHKPAHVDQFDEINRKLDEILKMLTVKPVVEEKEIAPTPKTPKVVEKKKTKVTKKKPVVKKK